MTPDTVVASLVAGLLTIGLQRPFYDGLGLALDNGAGPGTYALTNTSSGAYGKLGSGASYCEWNTRFGGGGTVVLTRYDVTARIVSGTFSFKGRTDPDRTGCSPDTRAVTRGTFNDVPF